MTRSTIAALLTLSVAACDPTGLGRSNPSFLVIGHRGAPNIVCENTMASFQVAAALGASAIETDICITADRDLVIWHDRDPDDTIAVARQSGAEGLLCKPYVPPTGSSWRRAVETLTVAELRSHYGYGPLESGRDPTAVIPRLVDLLDWLRTTESIRAVYLDLKFTTAELPAAIAVLHMVAGDGIPDPTLAHVTFYLLNVHSEIVRGLEDERVRMGTDAAHIVWDFEGAGALAATRSMGLRDVCMGLTPSRPWNAFKIELADAIDAREAGLVDSVTVWTFDREMQLDELLYYSVDGVMTNEAALLHRLWLDSLN